MAAEFVTTIKTNEIPVGDVTAIDVRGTRIAVANVGGTYYAFDDACTHEQCSLAEKGNWPARPSHARATARSSTCGRARCSRLRRPCPSRCTVPGSRATRCKSRCDGPEVRDRRREPGWRHGRHHAARRGRRRDVILIGAEPEPPYERPRFPKPICAAMCRSTKHWCGQRRSTQNTGSKRCSGRARRESTRQRASWSLRIVVACRSTHYSSPRAGVTDTCRFRAAILTAFTVFGTVQDADRIRAEMIAGRRVVVVGMGFIGSEVAASLRQKGLDVVAIDPSKTPLFRVLGEDVGQTHRRPPSRSRCSHDLRGHGRRFRGNATCGLRRHQRQACASSATLPS